METSIKKEKLTPSQRVAKKVKDLQEEMALKKLKKQNRQVYKKTGKIARNNTTATPVNTKQIATKMVIMAQEMELEIEQKKITNSQIIKALSESNGNITRAAKMLRLYDTTLFRKVKYDPEVAEFMELMKQRIVDKAQDVINEKLDEGDAKVALFVLETKGNYSKRVVRELSGRNGKPIEVNNTHEIVANAGQIIDKVLQGIL